MVMEVTVFLDPQMLGGVVGVTLGGVKVGVEIVAGVVRTVGILVPAGV